MASSYLENLVYAVTRSIDPKRLYDWMIAISRAVGTSPSILGIGPFDTVARASANRMLDAPSAELANVANGAEVWCESFGGCTWIWRTDVPSGFICDNVTSCRPTAWIATGKDGAFVRSTEGNERAQIQPIWHVKKSAADNEGAGTALDPVQDDAEILRRWGTGQAPPLSANVTVTYDEAPTTVANYDVGILPDIVFKLVGTPTVDLPGVVISAVQAQVRTPGSEAPHAITGVGLGAHVGAFVQIVQSATPSHVGAYARILADLGANKVMLSPFGQPSVDFTVFTEVTPSVNDVVDVKTPMTLPTGNIRVRSLSNVYLLDSPPRGVFLTDWITFDGGGVPEFGIGQGCIDLINVSGYYFRSIWRQIQLFGTMHPASNIHALAGGGFDGGVQIGCQGAGFYKSGGLNAFVSITYGAIGLIDTDTYFQNSTITNVGLVNSFGAAIWNYGFASAPLAVLGSARWEALLSVQDWGTGNTGYAIRVSSGGMYAFDTKPSINGTLGAGRESLIGGTDKQYAAVPYVEGNNLAALVLNI